MRAAARAAGAAALALLLCAGEAQALGWNLTLNPAWNSGTTWATDETGRTSKSDFTAWTQRYRLNLDQEIMPLAVLSAGGTLDQVNADSRTDGVRSSAESRSWNGFASLRLGARPISGGLDYTRREQASELVGPLGSLTTPTLVRETYGATLALTPADLPSLQLQLSRADTYDKGRLTDDRTAESATAALRWAPIRQLDASYGLVLARDENRKSQVETTGLQNSLSLRYGDNHADGRVSTYVNYSATTRSSTVRTWGTTGTVATQQFASLGLSKVEAVTDRPARIALNPNAELIDGNTAVRAGLNLGYGATATGDRANRHMGASFPNLLTPVNAIHVSVDRTVPATVAASLTFTAWQSDNNLDWTPVDTGAVTFDTLLNRFEIAVSRVQARYLKVVTAPLPLGLTTDPLLAELYVTEVQFFIVESATEAQRRGTIAFSETASGSVRASLIPKYNLGYDFSGTLTHNVDPTRYTWSVSNALGLSNRINPWSGYAARLERSDSDVGAGHVAQNQWSASLNADPIPTFGGNVTYSGQYSQERAGNGLSNAFGVAARADLYEGIATGATANYSIGENAADRFTEAVNTTGSLSLVPNRALSLSGTIGFTRSRSSGGGLASQTDRLAVAEGSVAFTPIASLSLAGTLRRVWLVATPSTSGSFSAAFSPLRGGALQLRYAYSESFETAARSRTRFHGPGLRWNIRPGWYVDGGAQFARTSTPAQIVETESYFANLVITLK